MGFRFRRSVKVGPMRVNVGKRGITSVSAGRRGYRVNAGRRGVRTTVGIPGTGLSYSSKGCLPGCGCGSTLALLVVLTLAGFLITQR